MLYLTWYLEEKKVRVAEIEQRVKDEFGVVIRVEILDWKKAQASSFDSIEQKAVEIFSKK
ncbi:hypothetical protein Q3C19_17925 [Bacteroides sp. ET489]|uniref:hypothetical protein n=1 Tax=Bacteroides TaxID=816 RepID=UPI000340F323|nr:MULTISPECIES: hypothetical protein [Bacteroides]MDO3392329.1 hypothetical protein [Bacteroides sp. ET489]CDB11968.1 unknown [Bacteroides sp. CAG:633]